MPEALQIPGPCVVYWKVTSTSTTYTAVLGRWDNDAPAEWHEEMRYRDVTTNTSGETPEESIVRGIMGRLNFALTKWDTAEILAMKKATNTSAGGVTAGWKFPRVGGLQVGTISAPGGGTVDIQFRPTIAGRPQYAFKYLRLRPLDLNPFGNQPLVLGLQFELMRPSDATDDTPYILETTSS